jgi:hypothetical protein
MRPHCSLYPTLPSRPANMKWITPAFTEILTQYYDQYRRAGPEDRIVVVKGIKKQLRRCAKADGLELPSEMETVCEFLYCQDKLSAIPYN